MGAVSTYYQIVQEIDNIKSEDELYNELKEIQEKLDRNTPSLYTDKAFQDLLELFSPRIEEDFIWDDYTHFMYKWTLGSIGIAGEIENIVLKKEIVYSYIRKQVLMKVLQYFNETKSSNLENFTKLFWKKTEPFMKYEKNEKHRETLKQSYAYRIPYLHHHFIQLLDFYEECLKTDDDFFILIKHG